MLRKEIDIHILYDPSTKDLELNDLLAHEDGLANILFRGVESVDTMMQAIRAAVETINEH